MPPIQVKLVLNGPTPVGRRVTFGEQPSWTELALFIERLFNIPVQNVGVVYMDRDYDHITATSDEELNDCFENVLNPTGTVRLVVFDLNAVRADVSPLRADSPPVFVDLVDINDERRSRSRTPSPIIMPPREVFEAHRPSPPSSPVVVLPAPPYQSPSTMPDANAPADMSPPGPLFHSFVTADDIEARMISPVDISSNRPRSTSPTPSDVIHCVSSRASYRSPTPPCVIFSGDNRPTRNRNSSLSRSRSISSLRERYHQPTIIPVVGHTRSPSPVSDVPVVIRLPRSRSSSHSPSPPSAIFQQAERRSRSHYAGSAGFLPRGRSRSYSPSSPRIVTLDGRHSRSHSFDRSFRPPSCSLPPPSPIFVQVRRRLSRSPSVIERFHHSPLRSRSPIFPPNYERGPRSLYRSRERYIPEPNTTIKDEIVKELKGFLISEIKHIIQSELSQAIPRIHLNMMDVARDSEQTITSALEEGIKTLRSEIKDGTEVKDLIGYVNAARVEVAREVTEIREEREQREKSVEGGETHKDSGQEKEVQVPAPELRSGPSSSGPIPSQAQALPPPPFARRCSRRWRDLNDASNPLPPAHSYHYPIPPRYPPAGPPPTHRHSFPGHPYSMTLPPIMPPRAPSPPSHPPPPPGILPAPPPPFCPLPPPRRHFWHPSYAHVHDHHHQAQSLYPLPPPPLPPRDYHPYPNPHLSPPPPPAGPLPPPSAPIIYPNKLGPGPINVAPINVPPLKKLEDSKAALDEVKRLYRERKAEFRKMRDEVRRENAREFSRERNDIQGNESSARLIDFESSDAERPPDSFSSDLPQLDSTVYPASSQLKEAHLVSNLFRRLKTMGFRTVTHPRLPSIVNREISKLNGQNVDEEAILTSILEELLTPEHQLQPLTLNPMASNSTPNLFAQTPTRFRGPGVIGRSATLRARMPGGF